MVDTDVNKKPLPIGKSFFDKVIEEDCYYVDKTLFIKDLIDMRAEAVLCTRPRRFGKTLNQTMLKCFFEDTARIGGKDTRALFRGLKIEDAGSQYMEHQGKYPVIFLSFKEAEGGDFDETCRIFKDMLSAEFRRHGYIKEKIGDAEDLKKFERLSSGDTDILSYRDALKFLSKWLERYYGKKTIILIDEYDVPLQKSWVCKYYKEMIAFIRPLLSSALKDNPHLQMGVITGCLRVSRESIFTGLNNLDTASVLDGNYSAYFGFTQREVDAMLDYYGLDAKKQLVRDWYNGYLFGNTEVYNPWSSLKAVESWFTNTNEHPRAYWVNTSGNDIIRDMIENMNAEAKAGLETLMAGGTVSCVVDEYVTYGDIFKKVDNLWNFLLFTGYLKKVGEGRMDGVKNVVDLSIPNLELQYVYETKIQDWFKERVSRKDFDPLYRALLGGNAETVQKELGDFLLETISYLDAKEDFYHGVLLGVLSGMREFTAKSNRETGLGRCDIVLRHTSGRGKAVILELKCTPDMREIVKKCEEAVKQIADGKYAKELETECYTDIIKYGISFCKKSCEVRKG